MGVLDDLFWNVGPDMPALAGRRARRVLRSGEAAEATVVGILVERTTSDTVEPEYRYALDVRTGTETKRVGVRERLPERDEIPLGTVVPVRVLGDRVVIVPRVKAGEEPLVGTWRMVDPPAEGVEDRWRKKERERIDAGTAARVTILAVAQHQSMFGPTENLDLEVRVAVDGRPEEDRRIDKLLPPDYARALVREGSVLPAAIDGDKLLLDWERAAEEA